MAQDLHIENNAICRSIFKTISKLRDQISLKWLLTSVHSKYARHSTEIIRQCKIKGPLKNIQTRMREGLKNSKIWKPLWMSPNPNKKSVIRGVWQKSYSTVSKKWVSKHPFSVFNEGQPKKWVGTYPPYPTSSDAPGYLKFQREKALAVKLSYFWVILLQNQNGHGSLNFWDEPFKF